MSHELTQLTANLWLSQSQLFDFNSGIFSNAGRACLIDPGIFPDEVERFVSFIKAQALDSPVIILTHSHWDHLMGLAHFPECKVIAQENFTTAVQGEAGGQIYRQVAMLETKYEMVRPRPFAIPQPHETFANRMSLQLGDLTLQLIHTPGHAADHLSIYLPEDGTLWAGDLLSDCEIPYVNHSLSAYEATLTVLAGLEIRCLVTGHGTATVKPGEIQTRIEADRTYLADLRQQVAQAVVKGLTVAETVEACSGFQHHSLEENNSAHRLNIESVYLELGGKADPTRVGWHQSFE